MTFKVKFYIFLAMIISPALFMSFLHSKTEKVFECDKQEDVCVYKTKTLFTDFITEKEYKLSDIKDVGYNHYVVTTTKTKKGRETTKTHNEYNITIETDSEVFETEMVFKDENLAETQTEEISQYIESDEVKYVYVIEEFAMYTLFFLILSALVFLGSFYKLILSHIIKFINSQNKKNDIKKDEEKPSSTIMR